MASKYSLLQMLQETLMQYQSLSGSVIWRSLLSGCWLHCVLSFEGVWKGLPLLQHIRQPPCLFNHLFTSWLQLFERNCLLVVSFTTFQKSTCPYSKAKAWRRGFQNMINYEVNAKYMCKYRQMNFTCISHSTTRQYHTNSLETQSLAGEISLQLQFFRQLKNKVKRRTLSQIIIIKVLSIMKHLKEKWKTLALVVLAVVTTYSYSYMDTLSNAYGLFSPTDSNKDLITFNDDRPPKIQHVETTTQVPALVVEVRYLGRDDVTIVGSNIAYAVNNKSVKYFRSKDDHVERSDQEAGASNQTGTNRTLDQFAGKSPNISLAENCQCDARTLANSTAQFSRPDLPQKLTQAGHLPQKLAISSTATISSTYTLDKWCQLQDPLKFKFTQDVDLQKIPELKQKDLDYKKMPSSQLQSLNLLPTCGTTKRGQITCLSPTPNLTKLHGSLTPFLEKTANSEAFQKMFPVIEEDKIANLKFNANQIHLYYANVSYQMPQSCEKDSFADLLYSEQPKDLSLVAQYVNNHPNANWTAGIQYKTQDASLKEICKLMGNIVDHKWKNNAPMKQCELILKESLPVNFQSRESWPECAYVREESDCDSCWDQGTTLALNDTACIKLKGDLQTQLSVADTTTCCSNSACFSSSCNGGPVEPTCYWFNRKIVVSSGPFGQDEFCYGYTMTLCARRIEPTTFLFCDKVAPFCCNFCPGNTKTEQASDKVKGMSNYRVDPTVDAIKKELFTQNSVNAAFIFYEDILTYTAGVQQLLANSWNNLCDDQDTLKIFMGHCGINDLKHAGSYRTKSTATKNTQNNDPKVTSDSNNLKTSDQTEDDVQIAPTSDLQAQAQTQACEDTTHPESKTTSCNPADQMWFNSWLVTAYLADLNKCSFLATDCLLNAVASSRMTCQGDLACIKAFKAVDKKNPEKYWDSVTELDARRTSYRHCQCYKSAVENLLTKQNQSRHFRHEVGAYVVSLDNDFLSKKCGIHDWNQLCGKIVVKKSPVDGLIQLDWQEHKTTHFKGRKLLNVAVAVNPGQCTGPTTNYNLLNTDVLASQTYGYDLYNTNARVGCDGVVQVYNPTADYTKVVIVYPNPLDPGVWHWVATFQQKTNIRSILFIERQSTSYIQFLVGDNTSYLNNPPCIGGKLTAGGWLDCSLSGKYLVLASTIVNFGFMEVMCYSQYFVHHNALSSNLSSTMADAAAPYLCSTSSNNCQASNVIRTTLLIWNNYPNPPSTPCCIYSQPQTEPTLKVTIPANLMIELVIITPSDQLSSSVTAWQQNIEVSIVNSGGEKQICVTLSDYNLYTEVPCKKVGNQIIVTIPGSSKTLSMAGLSILSNCECSQSSLNPTLISFAQHPLASPSTIITTSTSAPISIKLNKQMRDTVSSVCVNADGFTKCGQRTLVFTDKMTGFKITFPYKGFELNSDQSELTLSPAKATPTCVLTVTVELDNYQTVTYQQEITTIVEQPAPVAVQPLIIPNLVLKATINQEAFLDLPKLDVSYIYFVVSKQKFEVTVDGNQLKVLSNSETDVGTYKLDLVAVFSSKKFSFEVKVILALPTSIDTKNNTKNIKNVGNTPTTTLETEGDSDGRTTISDEENENLLETAECTMVEANDIYCVSPDGLSFLIKAATDNTVSGDSKKKAQLAPHKLPKLSISKVSTKGQFYLKFSEPVGLEALNIPASQSRLLLEGWQPQGRRLKFKNGAKSSNNFGNAGSSSNHGSPGSSINSGSARSSRNSSSESYQTSLNFLSGKHLSLTIKSQNTTATVFSWRATNITSTLIKMQLEFQDPLYISTSPGVLDRIEIQILPTALMYMRSLDTGEMTENVLKALSTELPPQVILGTTIEAVEKNTIVLKDVAQSSSLSNIIIQIVLSQSMGQMWSMVNAQQIIMSYQFLNLKQPGNVILVSTKLSDISSFTLFPVNEFFAWLFYFTPTDSPGLGFECMGVDNASVTLYQGMTFIIMIFIGLQYLVYGLAYGCRLYDRLMSKIEQKLRPGLCFGLLYLFLQESYLDWAIGSTLRLEQPKFETPSDYFDFGLGCAGILITVVFPCYCFFFLKRNVNQLDDEDFKSKHGALYEGFSTNNADRRSASIYMAGWFLLRRFLTAVNLVFLRDQTIWIQLTLNMWLSLIDVCVKIHLSPYESKLGGFMEKFNDLFVMTCAYFPYLFTGLIPSPEDQYLIGWFYNGTVCAMVAANVFILVKTACEDVIKKIRKIIVQYQVKKATASRNAIRWEEEKMVALVQLGTFEGVIKEEQRAFQLQKQLEDQLAEIPEVEEISDSAQSDRPVQMNNLDKSHFTQRKDIKAQIWEKSASSKYQYGEGQRQQFFSINVEEEKKSECSPAICKERFNNNMQALKGIQDELASFSRMIEENSKKVKRANERLRRQ